MVLLMPQTLAKQLMETLIRLRSTSGCVKNPRLVVWFPAQSTVAPFTKAAPGAIMGIRNT